MPWAMLSEYEDGRSELKWAMLTRSTRVLGVQWLAVKRTARKATATADRPCALRTYPAAFRVASAAVGGRKERKFLQGSCKGLPAGPKNCGHPE
jgi:hypothetical protein